MCMLKFQQLAGTNSHLFTLDEEIQTDIEESFIPEGTSFSKDVSMRTSEAHWRLLCLPCKTESDYSMYTISQACVCLCKPACLYTYCDMWGNHVSYEYMQGVYAQQSCACTHESYGTSSGGYVTLQVLVREKDAWFCCPFSSLATCNTKF